MRGALPSWAITGASAALLLALWVGVTSGGLVRDLFLSGPLDVWDGLTELVQEGYKGRSMSTSRPTSTATPVRERC